MTTIQFKIDSFDLVKKYVDSSGNLCIANIIFTSEDITEMRELGIDLIEVEKGTKTDISFVLNDKALRFLCGKYYNW